jgi:transcriptional/translational regulatory protein YebC/TACO1
MTIDDKEKAEKLLKLIDALEDSDDVQQVFGNYEFCRSCKVIELKVLL